MPGSDTPQLAGGSSFENHPGRLSPTRISLRQGIRPQLKLYHLGLHPFAAFDVMGRPAGVSRPYAFALPAAVGIVDPAVHALGEESHGIRNPQGYEFTVDEGLDRVIVLEDDVRFSENGTLVLDALMEVIN